MSAIEQALIDIQTRARDSRGRAVRLLPLRFEGESNFDHINRALRMLVENFGPGTVFCDPYSDDDLTPRDHEVAFLRNLKLLVDAVLAAHDAGN